MKSIISCWLVLSFSLAFGQEAKSEKKTILFVCEHGAARSLLASAYFNRLAAEKGLNYTSIFRGTHPDPTLNKATVAGLKKDGLVVPDQLPVLVTDSDQQKAATVVTFDCNVPTAPDKPKENWTNIPSIDQNYDEARDVLLKNVRRLIEELEKP